MVVQRLESWPTSCEVHYSDLHYGLIPLVVYGFSTGLPSQLDCVWVYQVIILGKEKLKVRPLLSLWFMQNWRSHWIQLNLDPKSGSSAFLWSLLLERQIVAYIYALHACAVIYAVFMYNFSLRSCLQKHFGRGHILRQFAWLIIG